MTTYYVATTGDNGNAGTSEGAAWADLGYAVTQATANGDVIYVKAGTYTLTTSTAGAGGPVNTTSNTRLCIDVYTTTPGDGVGIAEINCGAIGSITVVDVENGFNQFSVVSGIRVDANGNASVTGFSGQANMYGFYDRCEAVDCATGFNRCAGSGCLANGCATGFSGAFRMSQSVAVDCTTGFNYTDEYRTGGTGNIAIRCTTGFDNRFYNTIRGCVAVACGTGFNTNNIGQTIHDCLAASCTSYGFNTRTDTVLFRCAGYDNASDLNATPFVNKSFLSLAADPFADAAGDNYSIADAALRGVAVSPFGQSLGLYRTFGDPGGGVAAVHPLGGA